MTSRFRPALVAISALATVWAILVTVTDGFAVDLFGLSVSSRNPRNPALLAILSGFAAWVLPQDDRGRASREAWRRWRARFGWIAAHRPAWAEPAIGVAIVGAFVQLDAWTYARPLWLDEQMIAINVRDRSLTQLGGPLWLNQAAPLGWLALERIALIFFGTGEKALRAVPVLFGLATLFVAAWAGRRWIGRLAAAIFVSLCAVNSWLAHYALEVKHYSADAFSALLLAAVAVWAVEGREPRDLVRRTRIWWGIAAVAHWFSNGGLLVVPACAVLLLVALWPRVRWRALSEMTAGGVVLLASFALHFEHSIRHTLGSDYLRRYWSGGLPPESAGVAGILSWLASQCRPLAVNPAGTELWVLFWVVVIAGCVVAPRWLGPMLLMVPFSAFVLGGLSVVPLLDRMVLWIVPTLYFGVASVIDRATRLALDGYRRRRIARLLTATAMAAAAAVVCIDIFDGGWRGVRSRRVSDSNHGLDDRRAVTWLMSHHQPGDAIVTTHLGLPAVWWYGEIDLSNGDPPGRQHPDGSSLFEAESLASPDCAHDALRSTLARRRRVLVYVGFPDAPEGFDDLLIRTLGELGVVKADQTFADASRAAIVDLISGSRPQAPAIRCINLKPANRW